MSDKIPTVNHDDCIGCQACVGACPVGLFEMKNDKSHFIAARKDECVHCESCIAACPVTAISMQ
uniref:Putative ferredoxin 2[4Fe-4S] n=1 Tax=Mastigamoeba balamuthi TaxID=108607 RepID=Q8MZS8_MASBA|nr:putative ferredoxin 2[4Fe-4S] [Mastigamoeba balamuthi]